MIGWALERADAPMNRIDGGRSAFPAYGPIDAALGYAVFYVFVTRATGAVIDVVTTVMPVDPGLIRLGLAATLWFILAATALDQARRQFAALGVGTNGGQGRGDRSRSSLPVTRSVGYVAVVAVGGAIAAVTLDTAIEAGISVIRVAATLDFGALVAREIGVMILFFIAFAAATRALDRLVIRVIRLLLP